MVYLAPPATVLVTEHASDLDARHRLVLTGSQPAGNSKATSGALFKKIWSKPDSGWYWKRETRSSTSTSRPTRSGRLVRSPGSEQDRSLVKGGDPRRPCRAYKEDGENGATTKMTGSLRLLRREVSGRRPSPRLQGRLHVGHDHATPAFQTDEPLLAAHVVPEGREPGAERATRSPTFGLVSSRSLKPPVSIWPMLPGAHPPPAEDPVIQFVPTVSQAIGRPRDVRIDDDGTASVERFNVLGHCLCPPWRPRRADLRGS